MANDKRKPGPEPETVKGDGPWEEAVKRALGKKKPPEGWPKKAKKKPDPGRLSPSGAGEGEQTAGVRHELPLPPDPGSGLADPASPYRLKPPGT